MTQSIANAFNEYFANIGEQLANSITPVNKSPLDYMTTQPDSSYYLHPVTQHEIEEISSGYWSFFLVIYMY